MSEKVNQVNETNYPLFLQLCIKKKVIGKNIIEKIEQYNNKTNVGMIRTLKKLNLISQDKMFEKFMNFLSSVSDPDNYEPLFFDIFPKSDKTLNNYFLFEANNILHHFVDLIISGQNSSTFNHSLLYIYGKTGNGKTHLLSAITNDVKGRSALMVSAADLEVEYERAVTIYSPDKLAQVLNTIELLIIEDIEHCCGNKGFQQFCYDLLMNKTSEKKNVIISSTIKPGDLKDMDPKLSSFLEESEIFEMQIGEKSECVNLLHQTYDNGELTQEAIEMLTEHFKEDVGQLLGAAEQYLGILEKDIIDAKNIEEENNNNGNDIGSNIIEKAESQVEIVNQGQEVNLVENSSQEKQPTSMKEDSPENSKKYGVENEEVEEAILIEKIQQPKNNTTNIIASQFKKMLVDAKTENELSVVLKFAFEEKLGQLSNNGSDAANRQKLEQALQLLDSGNVREAVQCAGG